MASSGSSEKASQQTKAKWLCLKCGLEFQGAKTKPECPECFNKCDFLLVRLNKDGLPAVHDAMGDENEVKALELTMPATLDDLEYNDELKELVRKRVLLRAERKKLEEEAEMLRTRKELERLRKGEEGEDFNGFNGGFSAAANPAAPLLITALAPTKEEREALLKELSENKELALSLGLMLNAPRYSMPFFPFLGGGKEASVSELADALKKLAEIVSERSDNDGIRKEIKELRETLLEVAKRDPVDDIKKLLDLQRTLREELGEEKGRKEEIELLAKAVREVGENTNKAIASLKATLARMEQERREGSSYERELERLRNQMKNMKEFVDALSDLTRTFSLSSGDSDDYYERKKFEHKLRLEELEKEKELEEVRRRRERDMVIARLLDTIHKRRSGEEREGEEEEEEEGEKGLKLEIDEIWKEGEETEKEEEGESEKKEEEKEKVEEEEESKEEEKKGRCPE